jgi:hypothetical protein
MSIAIGLCGKDSIVLATDSRMTSFTPDKIERIATDGTKKLWAIGNKFAIAGLGNIAGNEARIIEEFKRQIDASKIDRADIFDITAMFTEYMKKDWDKWMPNIRLDVLMSSNYNQEYVLVGYEKDNIPQILRVYWDVTQQVFLPRQKTTLYHISGVIYVAEYWMEIFKDYLPTLNCGQLKKLAAFLINESSKILPEIGGKIQMVTINPDEGISFIDDAELEDINKQVKGMASNAMETLYKG